MALEHSPCNDSATPANYRAAWQERGFISGIPIITEQEALDHRRRLEAAESRLGKLHYQSKIHSVLRSAHELAVHPKVLDLVEALIGPNLLLYNVTYIVKEAHSPAHVSWHQDLTYWGLDSDDQVSMWLALSPATQASGCMRMLPGSHVNGRIEHQITQDETNVLLQGQTVTNVDENAAVLCPLQPGQATFHHGWTLHASLPNQSDDRRIGLNVQYLATHVRQTKQAEDSALLVRGIDQYHYYKEDQPASEEIDWQAFTEQQVRNETYRNIAGTS